MTRRFGIDTSILVRLITGDPEAGFRDCVRRIGALIDEGHEVFASNQAIGEAYVAVQHHYGISKTDARSALHAALRSGLVAPLNGRTAIAALEASDGAGLLDRLIADDYARADLETLTLDRKTARLADTRRL